jgi:hypothetical protein
MGIMRQTLRFSGRKTQFLQKSDQISAKFPKAFSKNRHFSRKWAFFAKIGIFHEKYF